MENTIVQIPRTEWDGLLSKIDTLNRNVQELKAVGEKELLTPKEVCQLLKCCRKTYDTYVSTGILQPSQVTGKKYSKILIKRADVLYFIESRKN